MFETIHVSSNALAALSLTHLRRSDIRSYEFRSLLNRLTTVLLVEALSDIPTKQTQIETPMNASANGALPDVNVGFVVILRASLGMINAALKLMPEASVFHFGVRRDEADPESRPIWYYKRLPTPRVVNWCVVLDPMLATAGTAITVVNELKSYGVERIKFVGVIGALEGVKRLSEAHPDVDIHLAAIDLCLDKSNYILPGLGDAGDRQFRT